MLKGHCANPAVCYSLAVIGSLLVVIVFPGGFSMIPVGC